MSKKNKLVIYWSRRDFRIYDNPALFKAIEFSNDLNSPLLPLFILEDYMTSGDPTYQFGYPSREFISRAIPEFSKKFKEFFIFTGKPTKIFKKISKDFEIFIFVNEDVHDDFYKQVEKIKSQGINVNVFNDQMTVPKNVVTSNGNKYSVFTPFKNAVLESFLKEKPLGDCDLSKINYLNLNAESFDEIIIKNRDINYENLIKLFSNKRLILVGENEINLDSIIQKQDISNWYYTEEEAKKFFSHFLKKGLIQKYKDTRDSLKIDATDKTGGTSKMSLALTWGLISARQMIEMIKGNYSNQGISTYISELVWREFYKYLMYHHKGLLNTEFQEKYRGKIKWVKNDIAIQRFTAWIKGETGYDIVDASMKQLEKTGWMHNRSRMIVASVLTKNLGVDWRWGQEYFRAVLVDLDEASNNGGWQWGASVGADPKPIRIFNPYLQQERFDPDKDYINKWLDRNNNVLNMQVAPMVDHSTARKEAMERYGLL